MQKKDVIYIDVEDDITAIIGKVKASKEKIVALVPPKRTGVLQSAVNLRLLARTADNADKRLVIITSSSALGSLAASAKIPIAKTLQSTPQLADLPTDDDNGEDDVIDGKSLSVGEHAGLKDDEEIIVPEDLENLDMDSDAALKKSAVDGKKKSGIKVPNFGTFRKRLIFGGIGAVLLVLFLVWANVVAPHATVIVSAKTSPINVKTTLNVGDTLSNDTSKNNLTSITQTDKVPQSVSFVATGAKQVGDKASGTVVFSNCYDSQPVTIDAGIYISNGSQNYVVQASVVVSGDHNVGGICTSAGISDPVQVTATDVGNQYNTTANAQFSVPGFGGLVTASSSAGIAGGDSHTATVVSADDVQKALTQIAQQNTDSEKKKLQAKFDKGTIVIADSFASTNDIPQLTPGIGEEVAAGAQAKLSINATYTLVGIAKDALTSYLHSAISDQLSSSGQYIYDTGASSAQFSSFVAASGKNPATVALVATGQVGLKIDDNQIKNQVEGKRSGEAIGNIQQINGVSDVSVNLSPFWVQTIPNDPSKITIQFKLLGNG